MRVVASSLVGLGLAICIEPMLAHHSIVAEYSLDKTNTINGTVNKVEWMNPHARLYLNVAEPDGTGTNWEVEMGSPNVLSKSGWTRESVKPGDRITIEVSEAKNGAKLGYARTVTWPDGRVLSVPLDHWGMPIPK